MSDLLQAMRKLLPAVESVTEVQSVGGGCISEARRVAVRDVAGNARIVFVKTNHAGFLANFQSEWDGLERLNEAGAIKVPVPLAVGVAENRAWLVTDWVDQGARGKDFFSKFGGRLAGLHHATLSQQIGLDRDNFLGSAKQINTQSDSWVEFVADNRIGYQIRWAVDHGLARPALQRDCEKIIAAMDQVLEGRDDRTSLLHGDLWSGNYLSDAEGNPVIVDPAIYYGCREAEFGMLRLFGSCPGDFYDSYCDAFPLPAGWQRRASVYVLYHLLNHLNLFGSGYHGQCETLAADILRH